MAEKLYDIFISYSSKDQKLVEAMCHYLEERNLRCFVSYRDVPKGKDWAPYIEKGIEDSKVLVYVHTESSNMSEETTREINLAFEEGCVVIPFRVNSIKYGIGKRYRLNNLNWLDAFPGNPENYFGDLFDILKVNFPERIQQKEEEQARLEAERQRQEYLRKEEQARKLLEQERERQRREAEERRRAEEERKAAEKARREAEQNRLPEIYSIEIGNVTYDGDVITDYGDNIYSSETMYLAAQINCKSYEDREYKFDVKWINPDGSIRIGDSSPTGYTCSESYNLSYGERTEEIAGWGGKTKGWWEAGDYAIEIWCEGTLLKRKEFTIY